MKRAGRLALRLPRLLLVICGGALLAGAVALPGWLGLDVRTQWRQRLTRLFMRQLSAALPLDIEVIGELPARPMLWVANHVSWIDIALLGALQPLSFLSKLEVRRWPLAGWLASEAGTLFIRRGAGDAALVSSRLAERLEQGLTMVVFPEGTSHNGSRLGTFHGRLLGCAAQANVAIQPVAIRYLRDGVRDAITPFTGDQDLPGHLLQLLMSERSQVQIRLLAPLPTQERSRTLLASQAQQQIQQALFGSSSAPCGSSPAQPGAQDEASISRPDAVRLAPGVPARP